MVMKKIIAFIICLALCVTGLAVGVMNQQAKNDATIVGSVDGALVATDNNVANTNSFGTVGATNPGVFTGTEVTDATGGSWLGGKLITPDGKNFYLTGDLTLDKNNIEEFRTTSGLAAVIKGANGTLAGTFDGQGHTITTSVPLFTDYLYFNIRNLTVAGTIYADEAQTAYVGAIACYSSGTSVINMNNVHVTADIVATSGVTAAGGFLGRTNSAFTINMDNCEFSGSVTVDGATPAIGGIVGYTNYTATFTMTNSSITASELTTTGNGGYNGFAGGIFGYGYRNGHGRIITMTNCLVDTEINAQSYAGGLVGNSNNSKKMDVTLNGCVVKCDVTSTIQNAGGIIGYAPAVINVAVKGTVLDVNVTSIKAAGGVVGDILAVPSADYPVAVYVGKDDNGNYSTISGTVTCTGNVSRYTQAGAGAIVGSINTATDDANFANMSYVIDGLNVLPGTVITRTEGTNGSVGGLFGSVACKAATFEIKNLNFAGKVVAPATAAACGTLIGTNGATITNGIVINNVNAVSGGEELIGASTGTAATITNCKTADTTGFTTVDGAESGVFTATLDADFIAEAKAMATAMGQTAQVGAIVTLDSYVTKIGEFTRDTFDAFYTENQAAIKAKNAAVTCLYMATDVVELGDETSFTVILDGATAGTDYTAVTFVKIGDLYIYSK